MTTLACFDLDGTLVAGDSFRRYLRFLIARAYLPLASLPSVGTAWLLRRLRLIDLHDAKARVLRPLAGIPRVTLDAWGAEFWNHPFAPRVRANVAERLRLHAAQGHRITILTSAPDAYLAAFAQSLNVTDASGTALQYRDGLFTGTLGAHLFGDAKVATLARLRDAIGADTVYCYADHESDSPLLRAATHAVAVYPTPRLRREAAVAGWTVIDRSSDA